MNVTGCQHKFAVSKSQKFIEFFAEFHICNVGDRGTRVNDIGLSFRVGEKEYQMKKSGYWNGTGESKWIDAHDNADIDANFYAEYESDEKDQLDCVFTIYHTHKPYRVNAFSKKVDSLKNEPHVGFF